MGHKAAHEYALPKPGAITREEAWRIVVEQHQGLVSTLTWALVNRLTEGGARPFVGLEGHALYEELIGAAQEAALVAIEADSKGNGRQKGKITTFITGIFWRRMQRVVSNLEKERGEATSSYGDLQTLAWAEERQAKVPHLPDLEQEPAGKLLAGTITTLAKYRRGEWVQASDWLDAREDLGLSRLTPRGRGAYNRFLRSKELT